MKLTRINSAYLPETILRDCTNPIYVQFRESEIGVLKMDTPLLKLADRVCCSDAIVAEDPLTGLWVCVAIDGRLGWSRGYKPITSAIKNAIMI